MAVCIIQLQKDTIRETIQALSRVFLGESE